MAEVSSGVADGEKDAVEGVAGDKEPQALDVPTTLQPSEENVAGSASTISAVELAEEMKSTSVSGDVSGDNSGGDCATTLTDCGESSSQGASEDPAAQKGDAPEGELSFVNHMWDSFDFLWKRRVEPVQRVLEQLIETLRARALLERKYAESIVNLSGQVRVDSAAGTMFAAIDAVMVSFRNRGEQSKELADQIEQDVVLTLEEVLAQHKTVSKKMHRDVHLLTVFGAETRKAHSKLATKYGKTCWEAEEAAQDSLQIPVLKFSERLALAKRAVSLSQHARTAESEYYAAVEQANRARASAEGQLVNVLTTLQEMEEKCQRCIHDGLRKLSVYEASWLRNLQYDLEGVVKASDGADPSADLQAFIRSVWKEQGQRRPDGIGVHCSLMHFSQIYTKPIRESQPKKVLDDAKAVRQIVTEEFLPLVQILFRSEDPVGDANDVRGDSVETCGGNTESDRNESPSDADSNCGAKPGAGQVSPDAGMAVPALPSKFRKFTRDQARKKLRSGLDDLRRRSALFQVLRSEILAKEPQNTELDNAKPVSIPLAALDALASVVVAAVDACEHQNDAWGGRDFMVLAQGFRAEADSGKVQTLLSRVYNHKMWSKVTFWEDILLVGIFEAHAAEAVWRRQLAAGSQFVQPSMTSFLGRFVAYMLSYGISIEQARASVAVTLRRNTAMLSAQTAKQYETLILQAYDGPSNTPAADAAGSSSALPSMQQTKAASMISADVGGENAPSRQNHHNDSTAPVAAADARSAQPSSQVAAEEEEDDFEAVALGLPESATLSSGNGQSGERRTTSNVFE
eukprot:TRINITY_DN27470_c0_g3_i1.p1 TRINITY_DN27470_c0_g3~~TRINITY_DN27470_c0_g3_i1.p1  ORF type:complete len:800 (-),score=169.12 TRINITY_DN27470_c0_g3_i1:66-2465(-)